MDMDTSKLQVTVTEGENWRRTLEITVPHEVVEKKKRQVAGTMASQVKLPGFRKGKIPASVVEKRFGPTLRKETVDQVIQESYREALELESIRPISEGQVEDVEYDGEEDLTFRVSFEVAPQVEVEKVEGFTARRPKVEVTEDGVQKVLNRLRFQQAAWKPVDEGRPEEYDQVRVKIAPLGEEEEEGEGEAREYEITLGEDEAIPDVEEAIQSLEVGETGDFTIRFPDDFPNEERRGEEEELRITLEARKVRELPELDDDFARSVGDFETMEELRERVEQDLREELESDAEAKVRAQLVDQILEANPFQIPMSMVEQYLQSYLGDTGKASPEEIRKATDSLRPQAERAVKRALAIDKIAENRDLTASEEDVDDRIQEIAEQNDVDPGEVYSRLQKSGRLEALERELTEERVFQFLKENSTIEDEN